MQVQTGRVRFRLLNSGGIFVTCRVAVVRLPREAGFIQDLFEDFEDRDNLRDHLFKHGYWNRFEPAPISGNNIDRARLIAAHDAGCARAAAAQRNGEPCDAGEVCPVADGNNDRQADSSLKSIRRNDQHRPRALLLMSQAGIEGDKVNIALPQSSSRPTGAMDSHCLSSSEIGRLPSHWSSSSWSV